VVKVTFRVHLPLKETTAEMLTAYFPLRQAAVEVVLLVLVLMELWHKPVTEAMEKNH
jgi:hypothetical protein